MELLQEKAQLQAQIQNIKTALRARRAQHERLVEAAENIEAMRGLMNSKMVEKRWDIPHHYHLMSLGGVLNATPKGVLAYAEAAPGHLRIFALANAGKKNQDNSLNSVWAQEAKEGAVLMTLQRHEDRIRSIDEQLRVQREENEKAEKARQSSSHERDSFQDIVAQLGHWAQEEEKQ